MTRYIAQRLVQMVPVLFLLSIVVFVILRLHGDPVMQFVPPEATPADIARLRHAYGFDRPLLLQYVSFVRDILHGNFGTSFRYQTAAFPIVMEHLPYTLLLTASAIVVAWLVALPTGVISALRQNSPVDVTATSVSVIGRAMPNYWLGIMLILVFAVKLGWLPVSGPGGISHLVLPAVTLGMSTATTLTRLIRSSMLEVIRKEYITTARAKGLSRTTVIFRHAFRNSLLSVITVFGLEAGWLLGGAIIIEQVFAWPGMGRLMLDAVNNRDMSIVQASVFVTAVTIMLLNLLVDTVYTVLDPRIKYR